MNQTDTFSTQQRNTPSPSATGPAGDDTSGTGLRATAEKARQAAGKVATQAKDKAAAVADEQKKAAADKLGGYSSRLRAVAHAAEEEADPNIAYFAEQAADRLESVADYVRTADLGRRKRDATDVARRHPALFMGGMLVAGLVLGSLAKASVDSLRDDETDTDSDDYDDFDDPYPHGHDSPEDNGHDETNGAGESADPVRREFPAANQTSTPATP
jgi:gas vesicle protein